nr:MAG: hypothetical protein 3 [Leviviridae sp.]
MKIPTMLLYRVLLNVGLQISDTVELDYREICSRFKHEGMSFLTISLPRLDDALLAGLASGRLQRSDFEGFRPLGRNGSLPRLLSGFFKRVFERDGTLKDDACLDAIFAIRQVARLFKKVELPCSKERIKNAFEKYVINDRSVSWDLHRCVDNSGLWASVTGYLWSDLERLSGELYCHPGVFGSGATAEYLKRHERWDITEWPNRSEGSFPSSFFISSNLNPDDLTNVRYLDEIDERPVRVVQVPKTLKTPRTISVEPSYMMLMQQSIAKPLMAYLENDFPYRSIRFTNQSVNRELARVGSVKGDLETIDLSDASDLVMNDFVHAIFGSVAPTFWHQIQDCRSSTALLPSGDLLRLRKFASMGSALCFPIEAMVFFTIVVYAILKFEGKRPSRASIRNISDRVAVYGDDIIVPATTAQCVMDTLEAFGLRVNHNKSFSTGNFRESCGGDFYKGVDVTPAYVRRWDSTGTLRDAATLASYVSLSNQLYVKGLWHASQELRTFIDRTYGKPLPRSKYPIGCLFYESVFLSTQCTWDTRLHKYRVKGPEIRAKKDADAPQTISGILRLAFEPALLRARIAVGYAGIDLLSRGSSLPEHYCARDGVPSVPDREPRACALVPREGDGRLEDFQPAHPLHDFVRAGDGRHGLSRFPPGTSEFLPIVSVGTYAHAMTPLVRGSLNESVRPYALCLKRKWTATPAGLSW